MYSRWQRFLIRIIFYRMFFSSEPPPFIFVQFIFLKFTWAIPTLSEHIHMKFEVNQTKIKGGFQCDIKDLCRSLHITADLCRSLKTSADLCRYLQISADLCRPLQISADHLRCLQRNAMIFSIFFLFLIENFKGSCDFL